MTKRSGLINNIFLFFVLAATLCTVTACLGAKTFELSFDVDGAVTVVNATVNKEVSLPKEPTKNGYSFDGWYFDKDVWAEPFTSITVIDKELTEATTVYAKFNIVNYTITYEDTKGAENGNVTTYNINSDVILLEDISVTGYTFKGWSDGTSIVTEIPSGTTGDITLTATWELEGFKINYNGLEGTRNPNPLTYVSGEGDVELKNPDNRAGYTFLGWSDGTSIITKILSSTRGEITLTATWEIINYNINYEGLEGATHTNVGTYNIETSITLTNPTERLGYDFAGWSDGTNIITTIPKGRTGEITLTATWELTRYVITYNNLFDEIHGNPATYTIEGLSSITSPTSRAGYSFAGWSDGTNIIWSIPEGTTGAITLTATWRVNDFRINYDGLEGATHTNPSSYNIETATITLTAPTNRLGYDFAGWSDGTEIITSIPNGSIGMRNLTATWNLKDYEITYSRLYGTSHSNPGTYTIESEITLTAPTERKGYDFAGWSDGTEIITSIQSGKTGEITLTATWKLIDFDITYEGLGGATHTNPDTYNWEDANVTLVSPTERLGYTFKGWHNGTKIVSSIVAGTTGNITLTATWELVDYEIHYEGLEGTTQSNRYSYTVEDEITLVSPTDRLGYRFAGWHDGTGIITKISLGTTGEITLTATWELREFSITYEDLHGTTHSNPLSCTMETGDIELTDPSARLGYTFIGWYDETSCETTVIYGGVCEDITIKALWEIIIYDIYFEGLEDATHANLPFYSVEDEIILEAPTERAGYTFVGWHDGTGIITKISLGTTGEITLTAIWE